MTYPVGFDAFVDPDIAMSYRNLSDPFTSRVPIGITNTWTATLYFRATLVGAPSGYSNYEKYLGSIGSGASAYKIWEFDRAKPAGRTTDQLTIELRAYTDAAYTQVFGYADLSCKYHLFDHEALTLVDHDDFDDGTLQGWTVERGRLNNAIYLTAPYSLGWDRYKTDGYTQYMQKSFNIGAVTRAFIVLHWRGVDSEHPLRVYVAGVIKMPEAARPPDLKWFRLCFFMPVNQADLVKLENAFYPTVSGTAYGDYGNLDEIWVVTE